MSCFHYGSFISFRRIAAQTLLLSLTPNSQMHYSATPSTLSLLLNIKLLKIDLSLKIHPNR